MKRTHIMIAVFFACILSPNLLFPILKTTADEGTGENRSLAAFPTLSLETIDTFPSGVEDWINDHAAFRNRFLSLNARLNLSLFQFGDSQDVITGKDGWYFYRPQRGTEPPAVDPNFRAAARPGVPVRRMDIPVSNTCLHNPPHTTGPPHPARRSAGYFSAVLRGNQNILPYVHPAMIDSPETGSVLASMI